MAKDKCKECRHYYLIDDSVGPEGHEHHIHLEICLKLDHKKTYKAWKLCKGKYFLPKK